MTTLLLRTTFRLHDNKLLADELRRTREGTTPLQRVVVPLLTDSVPGQEEVPRMTAGRTSRGRAGEAGDGVASIIVDPAFEAWKDHPSPHASAEDPPQHRWGYHQYTFFLHTVAAFLPELRAALSASIDPRQTIAIEMWRGTAEQLARALAKTCVVCATDVVDDVPMWGALDRALRRAFRPAQLRFVSTHTLLDWRDPAHAKFLLQWNRTKNNRAFKDYAVRAVAGPAFAAEVTACDCRGRGQRHLRRARRGFAKAAPKNAANASAQPAAARGRSSRRSQRAAGGRVTASRRRHTVRARAVHKSFTPSSQATTPHPLAVDVIAEANRWASLLRTRHLVPCLPPSDEASCESWALAQLTRVSASMASAVWNKPTSAPSLAFREHATNPLLNTSKLSPFLALGVLSPRLAFLKWRGPTLAAQRSNASRPSSAMAQLLWREEFHAASRLPRFWDTRALANAAPSGRFWRREVPWAVTRGDDPAALPLWTGRTGLADLDAAQQVLVRDGWVHHLRRHVIADYITRGKLHADWMLGESWFRHTLVDHDACLNRCNWMSLSASEFSTAQLRRHYGWASYVTRKSKGVVLAR